MSHRFVSYYALVITLLFGLVLSLIPISPVLGDNFGACQGTTSTGKVSFGGRVITPTLILRASGNQPCAANETTLSLVSLSHTIIVSPNGTSIQNGTALLTAMTTISNANPSASNPYLLKLEPGNYDLGNQSLTLLPFVDLEGSGEDTTTISSTVDSSGYPPTTGTLIAASNSETRFLKVASNGSGSSTQIAVLVPLGSTNVRFTHLSATASNGTYNFGLSGSGVITIQNSTLSASGGSFGSWGLYTFSTANFVSTITIQNSTLSAAATGTYTYGLENNTGVVTIQNSTLSASGGSNSSYGLSNSGTTTIQNSTLSASGANSNYGFANSTGTAVIQNSTLSASGGSSSYGLYNPNSPLGIAKVGASQLSGSTAASSGLTLCPASYNGITFQPLNANCQ